MFNSPSSRLTPRKTGTTRPRESLSSRANSRAPSLFSEASAAHTPSRPSRLALSRIPASPTSSAGETSRTVREVEGYERITWSKDERYEVYSAGQLPREVQAVIKQSDLVTQTVSGHVDPVSGFAFVSMPDRVIAWNYQKRTYSSTTCYTFPAPPSSSQTGVPAMASLFSGANATEPGLVIVGSSGEVRFWESMSIALSNAERYQELDLNLAQDDYAEKILRLDSASFLVTTTSSLAYRVIISVSGGRAVPIVSPLTRSGGMFSRASNVIFPRNERGEGITAAAQSEGAVYILSGKILQKWIFTQVAQRFVQEYDVYDVFGREYWQDAWSSTNATVQLRDLVPCGRDKLAALVSYAESQSTSYVHSEMYAIHIFAINSQNNALQTQRIIDLSYRPTTDARALDCPKLLIPASSPTAFVRFASTAVAVSLAPVEHEEIIALRDAGRNAFIGTGCISTPISTRRSPGSALLLMPIIGGLIGVDVLDNPIAQNLNEEHSATAAMKSKMEQAVFYGNRAENPLNFDFPSSPSGDVAAAAEAVSADILSSSSPHQPALFEVRPLLEDRMLRFKKLISFIHANKLMERVPQLSRRTLSRNAEKAKAALELWDIQNKAMIHIGSHSPQSILADSILSCMQGFGSSQGDDPIRDFFRYHIARLDNLLSAALDTFKSVRPTMEGRQDFAGWVKETNRIFLTVQHAAIQYRTDESAAYDFKEETPVIEAWTASVGSLDALEYLYQVTETVILERTRTIGSVIDDMSAETRDPQVVKQREEQKLLKDQLADIAANWCTNMEDRVRTQSQRALNHGADPNEGMSLLERWKETRAKMIKPLVGFDRVKQAYWLAEHHSDFVTLVWLCHDPRAGQDERKIQTYIERFGEEFAFELYKWYIEQGKLYSLMTQDEVYGTLLTKFFEDNHYPDLAWMHHIACKRYGQAAMALISVDEDATVLAQKYLVGSIGKLAAVADLKSKGASATRQEVLNQLDEGLELVEIQNALRTTLSTAKTIEAFINAHAANLDDRPTFRQLFVDLAQDLVNGHALDLEGLVDILTLKDNRAESVNDGIIALNRLVRDSTLPEGRKQVALLSSWRRIFIRDDWNDVANTAGRSDEAQRQTLRSTMTYHTLNAITDDPTFPQPFVVSPYDASTPPYTTELSARFPDWTSDQIDDLMRDHEVEIERLKGYIEDAGLERLVKECAELVKRDRVAAKDEDVEM